MLERVVLFSVDGMRPDAMTQADAPAMRRLREQGAYTLSARTVMPSITLPTHMSMFHGVPPEVHGVISNEWRPIPGSSFPGLIDLLRQQTRHAAVFYTWEELRDLWRPGSAAYTGFVNIYARGGDVSDAAIARLAADYIVRERPDFTFVYLGLTDEIAHRSGWMSAEYLRAVAGADAAIASVLTQMEQAHMLDSTAVIVTADHGGHGQQHGTDVPEDMTIPWVVAGPGIKRSYQIQTPVRIFDTAPTIAALLGLPIPGAWQGIPVLEILE